MRITIEQLSPKVAQNLCRKITANLPEYFGLPACNEHYAMGVLDRINFAAKLGNDYVGLLCLDFPYPTTANIYWMGVMRENHRQGVGALLLVSAMKYAHRLNASTLTVETLAPKEADKNYLKTYQFYRAQGFSPLFNLKPENYDFLMVYMAKNISDAVIENENKINLRSLMQTDIQPIVEKFSRHNWVKPASTFITYLAEQNRGERIIWLAFSQDELAGYVTLKWLSSYPSFRDQNIPEIMDLNVLPPYRKKGIGSCLLARAEHESAKKSTRCGLGVGLYGDYGQAQRLYIKRGYLPDGLGITSHYNDVVPGGRYAVDDDLVLWLTKKLV
ncbi:MULTISPECIES: GNAT family N-acetyltransferase [unclassified Legionella]|uniref:GNAT family N-acetyltransferase n=1 Tax=unclassified Legionella TaxID=2622702 RepID=UPI001E43391A|nr:GNAT family N-acetyltransferase [Legionella sp. 31fI33]MCC5015518.1 GNAT family N-acetyltransferase [Legionella sp. 31fI33]